MSAAAPRPLARHLPALDGARGVAILLVLFFHFAAPFEGEPGLFQKLVRVAMAGGWIGVDLFFVLSGFLITRNLLTDDGAVRGALLRFWRNRALRIFPAYYIFLVAQTLIVQTPRLEYWLYYCNWTQPFHAAELSSSRSHLWSLAIEEQFYLFWPLAVLLLRRERLWRLAWWIVLLAPVLRGVAVLAHVDPMLIYRGTIFRIDALVWGALLALGASWKRLPWIGAALTLPVVVACKGFAFGVGSMQIVGYSGLAIFFAGFVGWAAARSPRLLELRPLQLAGKYSYGAYLLHFPLVLTTWDAFAHAPVGLMEQLGWIVLQSLAVFAGAALSYELFEKHFLQLQRRRESAVTKAPVVG